MTERRSKVWDAGWMQRGSVVGPRSKAAYALRRVSFTLDAYAAFLDNVDGKGYVHYDSYSAVFNALPTSLKNALDDIIHSVEDVVE